MSTDLDSLIRGAIASTTDRRSGRSAVMPQVSLLPAEIRSGAQDRRVRVGLVALVAVAALATGAGFVLASDSASDAEARAATKQSELLAATAQLGKFNDIRELQQRIVLGTAALRVGSSTEIDWKRWTGLVLADMPAGFTLTGIKADGATPYLDYAQGATPIDDGVRAATITVTATTPSITELPVWLRELKGLQAYTDLSPAVSGSEGDYTVEVVVHLSPAAYVTPLEGTR